VTVTLDQSYRVCRGLNRRYGTTYFWSTYLLPRVKRHHVHALYAFCRYADDIADFPAGAPSPASSRAWGPNPMPSRRVNDLGMKASADEREAALTDFGARFFVDLEKGRSDDPVLKAVVHTVKAFDIGADCFRRFLRSMAMDFGIETYETFDALLDYMDGSAAVIGEMMLPILEPSQPEAFGHARDLGIAFQLSNFLRDVNEDLDRGRVYIPQEDIRKFGADPWDRRCTAAWRDLMAFEIARTRAYYESADLGVPMLPPRSARCIRGARILYSGILEEIEAADYDVFTRRVRVPTWKKLAVAFRLYAHGS